jgi:hypothetical protein
MNVVVVVVVGLKGKISLPSAPILFLLLQQQKLRCFTLISPSSFLTHFDKSFLCESIFLIQDFFFIVMMKAKEITFLFLLLLFFSVCCKNGG